MYLPAKKDNLNLSCPIFLPDHSEVLQQPVKLGFGKNANSPCLPFILLMSELFSVHKLLYSCNKDECSFLPCIMAVESIIILNHHPHYSTYLRLRRETVPLWIHISGGHITITFNIGTASHLFPFVLWEATSVLRIWYQFSHETKEQLCLCFCHPFFVPLSLLISPYWLIKTLGAL